MINVVSDSSAFVISSTGTCVPPTTVNNTSVTVYAFNAAASSSLDAHNSIVLQVNALSAAVGVRSSLACVVPFAFSF